MTAPIAEGVTVRQDQPIINLPDPLHMRVKARINESKLSFIQTGQSARIVIDAFRERPLKGRVSEVTAINTPLECLGRPRLLRQRRHRSRVRRSSARLECRSRLPRRFPP